MTLKLQPTKGPAVVLLSFAEQRLSSSKVFLLEWAYDASFKSCSFAGPSKTVEFVDGVDPGINLVVVNRVATEAVSKGLKDLGIIHSWMDFVTKNSLPEDQGKSLNSSPSQIYRDFVERDSALLKLNLVGTREFSPGKGSFVNQK